MSKIKSCIATIHASSEKKMNKSGSICVEERLHGRGTINEPNLFGLILKVDAKLVCWLSNSR